MLTVSDGGIHSGRGCLTCCAREAQPSGQAADAPKPLGAPFPGSNPPRKGKVYHRAPLFRRIPMGSVIFWKPPGVFGLQFYARTNFKRSPCAVLVRFVGCMTNREIC